MRQLIEELQARVVVEFEWVKEWIGCDDLEQLLRLDFLTTVMEKMKQEKGKQPMEPKSKLSKVEKAIMFGERAKKDTKCVLIGGMGGQIKESQSDDSSSDDDYPLDVVSHYHSPLIKDYSG